MEHESNKVRLTQMLGEITEDLKSVGILDPENLKDWTAIPDNPDGKESDLNDAADNVEEWNERRALVATLETRYNNIKDALERVDAGTYGVCEVCGKEIEPARLEANPAASTCKAHLDGDSVM